MEIDLIRAALGLIVGYCLAMWLVLAYQTYRYGRMAETETFHLGICLVLALGFLGLIETALLT
jgi:uncharacterized membrane protein YhdT